MPECEHCVYNMYDEEYDEYTCTANIDEDEMARLMQPILQSNVSWICKDGKMRVQMLGFGYLAAEY